jgi:hypothetical protein
MNNWRDLQALIDADRRAREAEWQRCHRPMWFSDAEPGYEPLRTDGAWRNVARVIALVGVGFVLVIAFTALACRAWRIEDDAAMQRTRETVAQMEKGR